MSNLEQQKKYARNRIRAGLCRRCGEPLDSNSVSRCRDCLDKALEWYHLNKKPRRKIR